MELVEKCLRKRSLHGFFCGTNFKVLVDKADEVLGLVSLSLEDQFHNEILFDSTGTLSFGVSDGAEGMHDVGKGDLGFFLLYNCLGLEEIVQVFLGVFALLSH